MKAVVEEIYVAPKGSAAMERVEEVRTVEGRGIEGDRYCEGAGFWTSYGDVCEVTLIESEDLDYIQSELGVAEWVRECMVDGMLDALAQEDRDDVPSLPTVEIEIAREWS